MHCIMPLPLQYKKCLHSRTLQEYVSFLYLVANHKYLKRAADENLSNLRPAT
jgi:hypothetical protein